MNNFYTGCIITRGTHLRNGQVAEKQRKMQTRPCNSQVLIIVEDLYASSQWSCKIILRSFKNSKCMSNNTDRVEPFRAPSMEISSYGLSKHENDYNFETRVRISNSIWCWKSHVHKTLRSKNRILKIIQSTWIPLMLVTKMENP